MKKILFMLTAVLLTITGCGRSEKTDIITIGAMPDVDSIPYIIAQKNGYYKELGLEVKIEQFKSARDRDSALQGGKTDAVITDMLAVLFSNDGGVGLIAPARTNGDIKLLGSAGSGIKAPAQLKGKKVGLSTNTIMEYTFDLMMKSAGVDPASVDKIAIPQIPTRLEMLRNGKVDAIIMPDPLATVAVQDGAELICSMEAMKDDIAIGVIAFTEKSIQEKKTLIKALFQGYNRAVDYLASTPKEQYTDFIIKTQGFPEVLKTCLVLPKYTKAVCVPEKTYRDSLSWLVEKKLINSKPEYSKTVDTELLR